MKYFDETITEDEINKIQKVDCIFTDDIISLDDKKNQKMLDFQIYQIYLRNQSEESNNTANKKVGDC